MQKQTTAKGKKGVANVTSKGVAHIKASFNNIIISITNQGHQVLCSSSAGKMGFKGAKKNTPYAAQITAKECAKAAHALGVKEVEIEVKGAGSGRESAIRAISEAGIQVTTIKDVTPLPHNGCRPPKMRKP